MEKKINKAILFFVLTSTFLMCSTVLIEPVNATLQKLLIEDFESYAVSATHGSSAYSSWYSRSTPNCYISNAQYIGTKSLLLHNINNDRRNLAKINYTIPAPYLTNFSFYIKFVGGTYTPGYYNSIYIDFVNNSIVQHSFCITDYQAQVNDMITQNDSEGNQNVLASNLPSAWYKVNVVHINTNVFNYSVWSGDTRMGYRVDSGHSSTTWTTFQYINIYSYGYGAPSTITVYFDSLNVQSNSLPVPPTTGNHVKFKFYDGKTGYEIGMYNYANGLYKPVDSIAIDKGMCSIGSSMFPSYYFNDGNNNRLLDTLNATFTEGNYYQINITSPIYYTKAYFLGAPVTQLQSFSGYFKLYDNITISIVLYPLGYEFFENEKIEVHDGLTWGLRTDKKMYVYPEQVLMQYMFPKAVDMVNKGKPIDSNWKIYANDVSNWNMEDAENKSYGGFVYDAQWHSLKPFLPPDTVDGIDIYEMFMFRDSWIPGVTDDYVKGLKFTVLQTTTFSPSGNITSILPYPVNIGEDITVTFNANNNGLIQVKHIPTGDILSTKTFDKPVTTAIAKFNFARVGLFEVSLYVNYGINKSLEDTETFYINVTGDAYEEWGYNVPYLMVEGDKIITEFDTLIVYYKSLQNNTEIRINSPRGSRAPFSTMVSNKTGGILKIPFKAWMNIGRWNISMNISTFPYVLTDYFNVIANEENFMDFTKNEYDIEESIAFYIRHSVRCKITFLKGDIQRGTDLFFENGTLPDGYYTLVDTSFFDYGTWTIQMWQTNNRIPIRLLVEDYIIINPHKDIGGNNSFFSSDLPDWEKWTIGAIITMVMFLIPLFILRQKTDSPVAMGVCAFSGFFGLSLSVLFGLFPIWVIAFIIIIVILVIAFIWQSKKIAT